MILKLPRWVETVAFILAFVAGYVNAIGLLSFEHQSVSHLSGTATLFGASLLGPSFQSTLHLAAILLSFLLGSMAAGYLLQGQTLTLGERYDIALFLESILLLIAFGLLVRGSLYGHIFASAACGLQNALATKFSGAIIRTTHVTGLFTDLGIMLGAFLRGEPLDKRKAKLYLLIIAGFILGGTISTLFFAKIQFFSMLVPVSLCLLIGTVCRVYLMKKP